MKGIINNRRSIWAAALTGALFAPLSGAAENSYVPYWRFQGQLSWGLVERTEAVIRNERELRKLWIAIHSTPGRELPVAPRPEVDFRTEMVIAIGMGRRSSGGYRISVTRVEDTGDKLRVFYETHSPGPNCLVPQSMTSPVELIRLQRVDKRIVFAGGNVVVTCDSPTRRPG